MIRTPVFRVASIVVVFTIMVLPLQGELFSQSRQTAEPYVVNDPRPLAKALEIIERSCGCRITYEDPIYSSDQVIDVTSSVRRDGKLQPKVFVPSGHFFSFHYESDLRNRNVTGAYLADLVESFNQSGNPGRFVSRWTSGMFHVFPDGTTGSVFDARIKMPVLDTSVTDTIGVFLKIVSDRTGRQFSLGAVPTNLFTQSRTRESADGETAEEVLTRLLAATGQTLSWQLSMIFR